jgi:4'-phosphopantetheinyl transferase
LHVSCSRSGPYAIFAVARGHPVGVDIEVANAETFTDEVAEIILSPPERNYYAALPRNVRSTWLARAWVAKEAILKGLGCGLEIHPGSINVATPFADDVAADTFAWTSRATAFPPWWLSELQWAASVVAVATGERPALLRFAQLTSDHGRRAHLD